MIFFVFIVFIVFIAFIIARYAIACTKNILSDTR